MFGGVGAQQVELELVQGGFGEKLAAAPEPFQVEELILDEPVQGFHIALIGMSGGRDADMLAVAQGARKSRGTTGLVVAADELAPIIGLPDQVAEIDSGASQVALGLRPEVGNVAEVFRVGRDLLEQPPSRFDRRQVLFALAVRPPWVNQPVGPPDVLQGTVIWKAWAVALILC